MSRKQRIIVSITGIVLVSLILIGLTYGYYLTKIKGNTNSKSISVVTANLLLEYADVNDELITDSAVEPGKSWTKTFVATNKGNKAVTYGVALENVVNQFERKDDIVYTLDCKQYSKTGFSIDKTNKTVTGTISGTCNGVSDETTFPTIGTILVENDIADDKAQVYTLTITYKEMNVDQSVDMNKTFSAKVNIVDPNNFKPYGDGTLATAIIGSAKTAASTSDATRTVYRDEPLTKPAEETSEYKTGNKANETMSTWNLKDDYTIGYFFWLVGDSETAAKNGTKVNSYEEAVGKYVFDQRNSWTKKLIQYDSTTETLTFDNLVDEYLPEKTLSKTEDDYGDSYYFRGNVVDNYVEFANMCWRIVRIQGDGSVKITLAAQKSCSSITDSDTDSAFIGTGDYGYTPIDRLSYGASIYWADYENSEGRTTSMKYKFNEWFDTNLSSVANKIKTDQACIGNIIDGYDSNGNKLNGSVKELVKNNTGSSYKVHVRLYGKGQTANATLKCEGAKTSDTKIFPLTADEIVLAGGKAGTSNLNYYLIKNAVSNYWWSLSPSEISQSNGYADIVFHVDGSGKLYDSSSTRWVDVINTNDFSLRPAVILVSGTQISSGDGTISNPYVIK